MLFRLPGLVIVCAAALFGQVKTKVYVHPEGCFNTYRLEPGRVLTSRGLIEDSTVNSIMKEAVSAQMNELKIGEGGKDAELVVRFMGGASAGFQIDDLTVGDIAMWNIGAPTAVSSRTYKKSALIIGVIDSKSNQTLWAAKCSDNFGDPNRIKERIEKAVAKAFAKFPKKIGCS